MTLPRRMLKGQTYMVSRRCSERRFFLKPTKATNWILHYAFGLVLDRYDVTALALTIEANHYHLILVDPEGQLDEFMRDLDQLIARSFNAHYGRGENFWSPGSYSSVEIPDEETLIRKLVYVITNPVKDGLVERPEHWPGICTLPEDMGKHSRTVELPDAAFFGGKRPKHWIARGTLTPAEIRKAEAQARRRANEARGKNQRERKDRSSLPKQVTFALGWPPWVAAKDRAAWIQRLRLAVEQELERIYAQRQADNKPPFAGAEAIRQLSPFASAGDTFPNFSLDPHIAPGSNEGGQRQQRLNELTAWRQAHQASLELWRNGQRDVVFPTGTCKMAKLHKCMVGEVKLVGV